MKALGQLSLSTTVDNHSVMPYYGHNIDINGGVMVAMGMRSVAVHITVPEEFLKEVDEQAKREHRDR